MLASAALEIAITVPKNVGGPSGAPRLGQLRTRFGVKRDCGHKRAHLLGSKLLIWSDMRRRAIHMSRQMPEQILDEHEWLERKGRQVEIESGQALQFHCVRCGRDFIKVLPSGSHYAVYVSIVSFFRLDDKVTARWLSEACPGKHLPDDNNDRMRQIAEIRVSQGKSATSKVTSRSRGSSPKRLAT